MHRPQVIAHRGASAYVEENSVVAYDLALALGADVLELDVRSTADGELVVVHDETLLRTTGYPHRVDELTRETIAELDPAARPLTLDAVLGRYGTSTRWLIDLKEPAAEWERGVLEAIDRHDLRDRAIVQSFEHDSLRRLHDDAPWLPLAALFPKDVAPPDDLEEISTWATGIGPRHTEMNADVVEEAHAWGLAVRPYTTDAPEDIERMLDLGVRGVITNKPDVTGAIIRRRAARPVAVPLPLAA